MTSLAVHCPLDPFARIEVRDDGGALVAGGVGELHANVDSGIHYVTASAAGRDVRRTVAIDEGTDAMVALDAPEYASAAPVVGTSTYVAAHAAAARTASRRLARLEGPHAGIVVMVRRPGGVAPGPLPRREGHVALSLADASSLADVSMEWVVDADRQHGEWAVAAARVQAGTYVATIGASPSCLVVPTWAGWQTLLFVPVTTHGLAPAMAAMHAAPLEMAWTPDTPAAALSDRLHWAVLDGVELTPRVTAMIATTSPLAAVMAGALSVQASDRLDPSSLPVLAGDADRLLEAEIESPGTITGPAIDAFAGRLSSPLWFRWRPSPAPLGGRPGHFDSDDWRHRAGELSTMALHALAEERSDDRAVARLAAYSDEQSHQRAKDGRGSRAQRSTDIADVVAGTGVPAIGLLDALRALPPPASRPPWRAIGAIGAVALAALLTSLLWPNEDGDIDVPTTVNEPMTVTVPTVTVPTTVTAASTRPTQDSSAVTAATSPVTNPPETTAPVTSPSTSAATVPATTVPAVVEFGARPLDLLTNEPGRGQNMVSPEGAAFRDRHSSAGLDRPAS